jgi:peptidoglycan/LPS O-acetylase OafA/YrhL
LNKNQNYITQLDGLRFLAVTGVMLAHWIQWKSGNTFIKHLPFSHGVILFFVLSGFLITKILLFNKDAYESVNKSKTPLIKSFYIRRSLRIFPVYYAVLFAVIIINYPLSRELFPLLATFTINIYQSIHNVSVGDFNHFWSLAVEEQFYLFWPWLLLFTPRKHFLKVIISLIILSIAYKAYIYYFVNKWMAGSYFVLGCTDALALGALAAYLFLYYPDISQKAASAFFCWLSIFVYAAAWTIIYYFNLDVVKNILDEFLFACMSVCIINRAAHQKFTSAAKAVLQNKFVVYCGKISYGIYLYHLFMPFVYFYLRSKTGLQIDNLFLYFITLYAAAFVMAHFSWMLIERPINHLKNKFPYFKP